MRETNPHKTEALFKIENGRQKSSGVKYSQETQCPLFLPLYLDEQSDTRAVKQFAEDHTVCFRAEFEPELSDSRFRALSIILEGKCVSGRRAELLWEYWWRPSIQAWAVGKLEACRADARHREEKMQAYTHGCIHLHTTAKLSARSVA